MLSSANCYTVILLICYTVNIGRSLCLSTNCQEKCHHQTLSKLGWVKIANLAACCRADIVIYYHIGTLSLRKELFAELKCFQSRILLIYHCVGCLNWKKTTAARACPYIYVSCLIKRLIKRSWYIESKMKLHVSSSDVPSPLGRLAGQILMTRLLNLRLFSIGSVEGPKL